MTPAETRYRLADLRLRVARAQMLLQLAGDHNADRLIDLLIFARSIGGEIVADTVTAFRAAQAENLRIAQAELDQLESGNTQGSTALAQSRYGPLRAKKNEARRKF